MAKAKFKVGQVVRINTESYNGKWEAQRYQRITQVFPWKECAAHPFGYRFVNGDEANEKWLRPLTSRESGKV